MHIINIIAFMIVHFLLLSACSSVDKLKKELVASALSPKASAKVDSVKVNATGSANWIADPDSGCKVYNPNPQPNEKIKWTGGCKDGIAEGSGTLTWFENGKEQSAYNGHLQSGKYEGHVVRTSPDGSRYEGEFKNGTSNGYGIDTYADGSRWEGTWKDGEKVSGKSIPAPTTKEIVTKLCNKESSGESIEDLACENKSNSLAGDNLIEGIQKLCETYKTPGMQEKCYRDAEDYLPPISRTSIAKYSASCESKKGKPAADCLAEVYKEVGIARADEARKQQELLAQRAANERQQAEREERSTAQRQQQERMQRMQEINEAQQWYRFGQQLGYTIAPLLRH